MQPNWLQRVGLAVLTAGLVHMATGCASERDPINRVQPNAISKHFFVGDDLRDPKDDPEFYMGSRIIDMPYGAGYDWLVQSMGSLSRIKWDIQEDRLVGRLTYERIQGSDHKGSRSTNDGQVVAAFAIQSHFDIRREYNPQTGEELNIITENSVDRPWYEREFFRVDWSKNLVTDAYNFDVFAELGMVSGIKYDPLSYYVEDPSHPDAPVISEKEGYLDVTTKLYASPQEVDTPWGRLPACFLTRNAPAFNCNPNELTVRLSFKKVVDTDYEPLDWDGNRMNAFGWFTVERYGYDKSYGILDEDWHRFAARYNLWEKSHVAGTQCAVDAWRDAAGNVQKYKVAGDGGGYVTDPSTGLPVPADADDGSAAPFTKSAVGKDVHRDEDGNKTEDECEFFDENGTLLNEGSRCDEFSHKCTIPTYARTVRTIPWYYGPDSPMDLFDGTARAVGMWNLALKRAVQIGKKVEAERVGYDGSGYVYDEQALTDDAGSTIPDVVVLCHNPVIDGDHAACGPAGMRARLGDLRYHMVNIVKTPQLPSPWGIMTDFDDPITGEKVQTSVNEWDAALERASQSTVDLVRWFNGEISDSEIAGGEYLRQWASASKLGAAAYAGKQLSKDEIGQRIRSIDTTLAKVNGLTPADNALPLELRRVKAAKNLAAQGPSLDAQFEGTRQKLMGTPLETRMITPEILQLAGLDPQTKVVDNDQNVALASPLRRLDPRMHAWANRLRETALATQGSCITEMPEPDSLAGFAKLAKSKFPLPDPNDPDLDAKSVDRLRQMHQWVREQFHVAVIAHEMGHSFGLRHNFIGSRDPLNYHKEYWQLRTRNGQEHYCGYRGNTGLDKLDATTVHQNGADCVGPRWVDPPTDTETDNLVWRWGSSTVMDYPGDQTQDTNEIGAYDKAAMRFGYVDVVDVDNDSKLPSQVDYNGMADKGSAYIMVLDRSGGILGNTVGGNHYSMYNDKYNVIRNCQGGSDADPLSAKCDGFDTGYLARRDMVDVDQISPDFTTRNPSFVAKYAMEPKTRRVRHPYLFSSDEYADTGNVPVFRFDAGADSYEQLQFLISTYENRYVFSNFRRDNVMFNSYASLAGIMDRWDKIQGMTKSLAFAVELSSNPQAELSDPGGLMPLALGAADGLSMFVRALLRPEPGAYDVQPQAGKQPYGNAFSTFYLTSPTSTVNVSLGSGEGRFLHNDYDYTQGYYWSRYQTQSGSSYEKTIAIYYLTEAYNNFLANAREDYIDGRYKNVSYWTLYPEQMRRLFATIQQNDPFTMAPYAIPGRRGDLTSVQYLPWDKYDTSKSATESLEYPDNAVLLNPLVGWEQQYRALIDGFYFAPTSLTMDIVEQMRVFSPGSTDDPGVEPDRLVRFVNPKNGTVYAARNYGQETINSKVGHTVAKTSGARMIQWANELASRGYVVDSVDPVTGEVTYVKDHGIPVESSTDGADKARIELDAYIANLDGAREVGAFLYGPLAHARD